ncbi:mechanosensitive ion channel domain-containing protein [Xanthomonas campestris pv. campestris]|jgi:small-conductance mechanosensitive channel|uniref:mechanosensitive ion channel domain-containing protein n=1 Tax=Xanthomonas campestris TaxID=339 RepID=UPI0005E8BEF7|nr:mechanosensitive ion channel domain-containing protein [Xanthomonas campestris]MDM7725486.1 mechanosensitive ion channel [Xanthomonas campestris pv. campestris]MDM7729734.1 mechanosensitive ion channel [Xanthomonas campestris pv. campestris]MDM7880925.1 mechanosensitive ion channel [Xanthomonas campestris pv. campestris]MDO0859215.1 mechanosensitive ion channel [Xanthomonas campestris pv. campestris]MEA0909521.1 mechanosensitive ion channel [Xanthomonas campestris pv. campestris]
MARFRSHCIAWLLLFGMPAWAQTSTPSPAAATPPADVATRAIETEILIARADTDERLAMSAIARAGAPDPSLPLAASLELIACSVDARLHQFSPAQLRLLPIMRLESLDRHWHFDARRYARWREAMNLATAPYAADVAELARRRTAWQLTRSQSAGLPAVLLSRIDTLIALLTRAEQALAVPLETQVALGTRANALESRLRSGQAAVGDAIAYIDRRLLVVEAPPLWQLSSALAATPAVSGNAISTGLRIEADFAAAYNHAHFSNQVATRALQYLSLPLLLLLWYRSRKAAAGTLDPAAARVLGRPWSTWLLLCMLVSLAFEPDAPVLTRQFAMLIALVPVLRLLPPQSRRLLDIWPYAATALFVLSGIGVIFLGNSLAYRLYMLALGTVALAITAWMLWRAHTRGHRARTGRLGRVLRGAAWLAALLFATAVVSNAIGNVSLGEMLTDAVIDSAYLGLLLFVGVSVVLTLLHQALGRPGVRRFTLANTQSASIVDLLTRLAIGAAGIGWVLYAMDSFRVLRPIYRTLHTVLSHEFGIGDFSLSLGHVLVFVVAIVVASWASRITRLLLHSVLESRALFARGIGNSIASLASYAVLLLGVVVALSAAGVKGSQLALLFGALGVGIGFGLQNVVNNFVSGLILMFERPIQPGDVVEIGATQGRVRDIGMRATRIRTFDGADVVVPNGTLLSERLTNWTLLDRSRRLEIKVGVAYGSDPRQVIALLTRCAEQTAGIVDTPPPAAFFEGFGSSTLDFSVRAWTQDYDHWLVIRSTLATHIHDALNAAHIVIPFPQQDVHVRSWPEAHEGGPALRTQLHQGDD